MSSKSNKFLAFWTFICLFEANAGRLCQDRAGFGQARGGYFEKAVSTARRVAFRLGCQYIDLNCCFAANQRGVVVAS